MPTLKELREAAGLTQKELAEKIGAQTNTVSRWEMAATDSRSNSIKPRGPARKLLGLIFGVDPETITYGAGKDDAQ